MMQLFKVVQRKRVALTKQLESERKDWVKNSAWGLRFLLCGVFMALAYYTFSSMEQVKAVQINLLIDTWPELKSLVLIIALTFMGYFGLLMSILAASLFNTLLIRDTKQNGSARKT